MTTICSSGDLTVPPLVGCCLWNFVIVVAVAVDSAISVAVYDTDDGVEAVAVYAADDHNDDVVVVAVAVVVDVDFVIAVAVDVDVDSTDAHVVGTYRRSLPDGGPC